jgi:rod shape determining protein RodA
MFKLDRWRHFDFWLFGSVVILCIFGIIMIRSAVAGNAVLGDYPQRQTIFVSLGLVIILGTALIDYHYWASLSRFMYWFAFVALGIIYVYGEARFGSARWVDTGLILIQPSELAKIIIIVVLAEYFASHANDPHDMKWLITSLALTMGIVVWIILQPNLSTSIVMIVIWVTMLWISGLPMKYLGLFAIGGVGFGAALYPFLEEYQRKRITNFLFPDPTARHGDTYNVDQALITIGSGGWFGMGYGHGTQVQLRFLKVRHTDFIFSVIAEEFGFVGTLLVVALLVFVVIRCIKVAQSANDTFGALIAYGIAVLIAFQTAVNIGVNLNLIPVTGLTLPFISYGGSSLSSLVLGLGLVESVAMRQKPLDF